MKLVELLTLVPVLATFELPTGNQETAFLFYNLQEEQLFFADDNTENKFKELGLTIATMTTQIRNRFNTPIQVKIPVVPEHLAKEALGLKSTYADRLNKISKDSSI